MPCSICQSSTHDRRYCTKVFCVQIIQQLFDSVFKEEECVIPIYEGEIAEIIMMGLHPRLGKNSSLRLLNTDIIRMILGNNSITQYCTTIHKSPTKFIKEQKILKNTPTLPIANPVLDPSTNDIYCISNNNIILSKDTSICLTINRAHPIIYFNFIEDCIIYIVKTQGVQDDIFTIHMINRDTLDYLWSHSIHTDKILDPIVISKSIIYLILPKQYTIMCMINGNVHTIRNFQSNIDKNSIYYNKENKKFYFKLTSNDIGSIDVEDDICHVINDVSTNMRVFKHQNDCIYYIESKKTIVKVDLNTRKKVYSMMASPVSNILFDPLHLSSGCFITTALYGKEIRCHKAISAVNDDHQKLFWITHLPSKMNTQPIFGYRKRYVYATTIDKYIHKICTLKGTKIWSIKLPGTAKHSPILHEGYLYIQTVSPSKLISLSA